MEDKQTSDQDLEIVLDQTIKDKVVGHVLWSNKMTTCLAVGIVSLYALTGLIVLIVAFLQGKEPPVWATVIESSSITGALAVAFKTYIPGGKAS